jgi:hypothetical protein
VTILLPTYLVFRAAQAKKTATCLKQQIFTSSKAPSDSKHMQIGRRIFIQNTESTAIKATTRAGEPAQREQSNAPLKNCRWAATREAGKLPGPSCTSERACKPQLLLHQSRPRYTMLDWHPSAQIKMHNNAWPSAAEEGAERSAQQETHERLCVLLSRSIPPSTPKSDV